MEWMTEFLQSASAWLEDKGFVFVVTGILGSAGAAVLYYFWKVFVPRLTNKILEWVVKVVNKMFGIPSEDVSDAVSELPIVKQMQEWTDRMLLESEIKLIELKNRLVSPKLNKAERIAYQAEFDYLYDKVGSNMSAKTKTILKQIEDATESYELG